jgi:hypothetical protein
MVLISLKEYEDLTGDRGLDAHAELLSHAGTGFGGMLLLLPVAILYYLLYSNSFICRFTSSVSFSLLSSRAFLSAVSPDLSHNQTLAASNISPTADAPQTLKQKKRKKQSATQTVKSQSHFRRRKHNDRSHELPILLQSDAISTSMNQAINYQKKEENCRKSDLILSNYSLGNITATHARTIR